MVRRVRLQFPGAIYHVTFRRIGVKAARTPVAALPSLMARGKEQVQHVTVLIYDGMIQAYKPWNVSVQTAQVMGADGNATTITFIAPPP